MRYMGTYSVDTILDYIHFQILMINRKASIGLPVTDELYELSVTVKKYQHKIEDFSFDIDEILKPGKIA